MVESGRVEVMVKSRCHHESGRVEVMVKGRCHHESGRLEVMEMYKYLEG